MFNLNLPVEIAENYSSLAQRIRVMTEGGSAVRGFVPIAGGVESIWE